MPPVKIAKGKSSHFESSNLKYRPIFKLVDLN